MIANFKMYRSAVYRASLIFCALSTVKITSGEESSLYLDEIRSLSELPMKKLIQIKSSLTGENDITNGSEDEDDDVTDRRRLPLTLPIALPLAKNTSKKPTRRYEEHYDEKGSETKVSRIFQLSVTALSFLAFGGYLLTLIIMSIRNNVVAAGGAAPSSILVFPGSQRLKRPKRNILIFDPTENNFETEKFYEGMIMLSRSYALYN